MASTRPNTELLDLVEAARMERHRRRLALDFRAFVAEAWPHTKPHSEMLPSIGIDGMCAALQAVADGRIMRLGIEVPPGIGKSRIGAVLFASWLLMRELGIGAIMACSYSFDFARRDSRLCRDLVTGEWFQSLIGERWAMQPDANRDDDWWTTAGGRRFIASPDGGGMGQRCSIQIIDDALSGRDIYSRDVKEKTVRWINEVLSSRFEDRRVGKRVMIGQRLIHDDPLAEARRQGWTILTLPIALEAGDVPCAVYDDAGQLVWRDPRAPGVPLDERWPAEAIAAQKKESGSRAFAAQFMQRPIAEDAVFFRASWFGRRYQAPPRCDREVIALDASFREGDASDFAVIQAWGAQGDDRYLLEQWRRQAGFVDTLEAMRGMRKRHPSARVLVEAAANGHAVIDQLDRELGRGVVEPIPTAGGKRAKWAAAAPICERGSVVLPEHAPWLNDWLDEVARVPDSDHDDQADAMAIALLALEQHGEPTLDDLRRALRTVPRR